MNVVCGSGLNCVNQAAQMIMAGDADIVVAGVLGISYHLFSCLSNFYQSFYKSPKSFSNSPAGGDADIVVAGGMENMSMAPYAVPQARYGYRMNKLIPEAFPAVTKPFGLIGRSFASPSMVEPCLGPSSVSKITVSFFLRHLLLSLSQWAKILASTWTSS